MSGIFSTEELKTFCRQTDLIDEYRNASNGKMYEEPTGTPIKGSRGYTVVKILSELTGLPYSNLILAYCHAFKPWCIRFADEDGCICTDAICDRITIFLDKDDRVRRIEKEVAVLFGCGSDIDAIRNQMLAEAKKEQNGKDPEN